MKFLDKGKKLNNKLIAIISLCALCFLALVGSSFAWFTSPVMHGDKISGGAITNYFHTGKGEIDDPFVITRPVHYFNLVNLYQKVDDYSDKHFYFQIGYEFNQEGEFLVYDCDEDGKIKTEGTGAERREKYSNVLNMECYDGRDTNHPSLLPIGTHDKNFLSVLDGKNITLKGFKVTVPESKTCDVGIFGFIGQGFDVDNDGEITGEEIATVKNVYFSDVTIDITNISNAENVISAIEESQTHGEYAQSHNLKKEATDPDNYVAYVGYIAGHIVASSQVENVFINEVTIRGGNPANTNFGYFGCISLDDGVRVPSIGELIASENGPGDEAGFGGSMDMKKLFTRINNVIYYNSEDNNNSYTSYGGVDITTLYPTNETVTYSQDGTPSVSVTGTGGIGLFNNKAIYYWSNPSIGTGIYIGNTPNRDTSGNNFNYLYGLRDTQVTSVAVPIDGSIILTVNWIKNGDSYLSINDLTFTSQPQIEDGAMWFVDSEGHWITYIESDLEIENENNTIEQHKNFTEYYLNVNSTTKKLILETTTPKNSNIWTVGNDGSFSTVIDDTTYYLVQNNGNWFVTTQRQYQTISDGQGNYLTLNNNRGIINGAESSSVRWNIQQSGNNYTFSVIIDGITYYLGYNNNGLVMNTSSTNWLKDKNGYYIQSDDRYYLVYDSGWKAQSYTKHKLSSNSHYLSLNNGVLSDTTNIESAIDWEVKGSGSSYTISAVQNNTTYYLAYSNPMSVTISTTQFTWQKNGDSYYHAIGNVNYYLQYYNSGWFALPQTYYTISDENLYMTATSPNTFATTTNAGSATRFYSTANTLSGQIMYIADNQVCYLGANGNSLSNTATTWVNNNNGSLKVQNADYYLNYTQANGWRLEAPTTTTQNGYKVFGNTRCINGNGGSIVLGQEGSEATVWFFSNYSSKSGVISYYDNGTTYYLYLNNNKPALSTTNNSTSWSNSGDKLYTGSSTYIRVVRSYDYNVWGYVYSLTTDKKSNGTTFTFTPAEVTITVTPTLTIGSNNLSNPTITDDNVYPVNPPVVSLSQPIDDTVSFSVGTFEQNQELTDYITTGMRRSTYIPIRVNSDDDAGIEQNLAYGVSPKNTGYIVSGTYSSNGEGHGDIRVSRYQISNVSGSYSYSYSNRKYELTSVYTCTNTTNKNIIADIRNKPVFETFQSLLQNSGDYVYGLHFMNAQISKNNIIQAETATIMGKTYANYDLPENSIDFNVVQRGAIEFFAGEYYTGNKSFFSLHEIFRDSETQKITDIKEIELVYAHKTLGIKKPYVYKYTDDSFSSSYPGDEEFNANYEVVFNTIWIKEPHGVSNSNKRIYYFEIPCNKGEFALGSVEGSNGAYLIYLDIATNGGAVIDTVVSDDGSGLTEHNFMVDVRPTGGVIDYRSLMQFSVNAPGVVNSDDFSITVSFTSDVGTQGAVDYPYGLYTIKIVNRTNDNIDLSVFLCDNDNIANNEYPYAYRIIYTNNNVTDKVLENGSFAFFKRCDTHTIPCNE